MHEDLRNTARLLLWVVAACLACTSRESQSADADSAQGETAVAAETAPSPDASAGAVQSEPVDAPLTAADVERWERGQRAEMAEVEKALEKLKSAKSATDTMSIQFSVTEQSTIEAGARAAGLSVDRYRSVGDRIGRVLSTRMMGEATQKMKAQVDTSDMTPEMRARVREGIAQTDSAFGDPYKDLAPDVATVLKQRGAQLDTLRWTLLGARMGKTLQGTPRS